MMDGATRALELFAELNRIPRCSGNEAEAGRWVLAWAARQGFRGHGERAGNVLVRVPGVGSSAAPPMLLQAHLDMVCEAAPGNDHNFTTDPVDVITDGEWLRADGTTLGADNGVGCALMMAAAEQRTTPRPPLELLFTVEEETGLGGAAALESDLESRTLLNLDSETEGVFTVGCAGGRDCTVELPINPEPVVDGSRGIEISVSGLAGGHSGVDIHRGRANANLILAHTLSRILTSSKKRSSGIRLAGVWGGSVRNAIPREARAALSISPKTLGEIAEIVRETQAEQRALHAQAEPGISVTLRECPPPTSAVTTDSALRYAQLVTNLPNGIHTMSSTMEGLVEASDNLAVVTTANNAIRIIINLRSSSPDRLTELLDTIREKLKDAGASETLSTGYPAWQPAPNAPIVQRSVRVYREVFGRSPSIRAIHAGLECAVIGERCPDMDMLSVGPTIEGAHSPRERVHIESVDRVFGLVTALLRDCSAHPVVGS